MQTKRLVIALDDFGSSRAANEAVAEIFAHGVATSTGLMVPCPWFADAAALVKERKFPFGVHMVISCEYERYLFGPLTRNPLLTRDGKGHAFDRSGYGFTREHADAVFDEILAQVERCYDFGIAPTHLESHMDNIPRWDGVFEGVCDRLWERFHLPLLRARGIHAPPPPSGMTIPYITHGGIGEPTVEGNKRRLRALLEACQPGLNWIGSHPARMTPELEATGLGLEMADFAIRRECDRRTLLDPEVKAWIAEFGIELVGVAEAVSARA